MRVLQGLSAGAGMVVGRAIIRDRFHGHEAQKLMSQVTLVFAIAPAIAPVIGGVLLNTLGWRCDLLGVACLHAPAGRVDRAIASRDAPASARTSLHPRTMWRNYRAVLGSPTFLLLAFVPALNFCAFFLYIAGAPAFLVDHLGVSTRGFGWLFIPLIGGVMIGATASGRFAGRLSPHATVRWGYAFMGGAAVLNLAVSAFAPPHVATHVLPIFVFMIGYSLSVPSITVMLLDLFPTMRGLVSSLQGLVQFTLGGVIAGTVAPLLDTSLIGLAAGMAAFTLAGFVAWVIYLRRLRVVSSP